MRTIFSSRMAIHDMEFPEFIIRILLFCLQWFDEILLVSSVEEPTLKPTEEWVLKTTHTHKHFNSSVTNPYTDKCLHERSSPSNLIICLESTQTFTTNNVQQLRRRRNIDTTINKNKRASVRAYECALNEQILLNCLPGGRLLVSRISGTI